MTEYERNAFVDGELVGQSRADALLELLDSAEERARVATLRRLKEWLKLAYEHPPRPDLYHRRPHADRA
ncbi:hypothetical protein [Thiohalobacter sp.]|uniref:hypothetical protein n=1 Tax=Thiohalobacter sp. TaxID=2025948 RepID=UPI0026205405|nr:hypothetical protein [Thiohalobacter sp.]